MVKELFICFFIILFFSCDVQTEVTYNQTGEVVGTTSCSGGPQPAFIISLIKTGSVMTANLPIEFQKPGVRIKFKSRPASSNLFCTTDKIYPSQVDVYDVSLILK